MDSNQPLTFLQTPTRNTKRPGTAFTEFAADVLSLHYEDIRIEQTDGVDGAIDASRDTRKGRVVFEFKDVGQDGLEAAIIRWRKVFRTLHENLLPAGPVRAQYQPWYENGLNRISHYVFCISSSLPNRSRDDALRQTIERDFESLAQSSGLRHLATIRVSVRDWLWFRHRVFRFAWLAYKWFPGRLPRGLLPLDRERAAGAVRFTDFLDCNQLPFYSIAEHLKLFPSLDIPNAVEDEASLLDRLLASDAEGLFIVGPGGVGKTRLMLELGRAARARGWTALQASDSATGEQVELVLRMSTGPQQLLLLVDYLETRSAFLSFIAHLRDLNAQSNNGGHRIRFIANCRSTFAGNVTLEEGDIILDLDAAGQPAARAWFEGYRRAATEHILRNCGIRPSDPIHAECRSKPIFAVFALYLAATGKPGDLNALRQERRFIDWAIKRLRLSFPTVAQPVEEAGKLLAHYPLPENRVERLTPANEALHNCLAQDQWLACDEDEHDSGPLWRVVHDILADQFLTRTFDELEKKGATAREAARLLSEGARLDTLASVLDALGRIKDISPVVAAHSWEKTISAALIDAPELWQRLAAKLLSSPLMSATGKLSLLTAHFAVWAEGDPEVAFGLGKFLRSKEIRSIALTKEERQALRHIIACLLLRYPHAEYLVSPALRWFPDDNTFRAAVLALAPRVAKTWQGQYILQAWLSSQADIPEVIARPARDWLSNYCRLRNASHLLAAWLGNGNVSSQVIADSTTQWFSAHGLSESAAYVLASWLSNPAVDLERVIPYLTACLEAGADAPGASRLFPAWLKNPRRSPEPIARFVIPWLERHARDAEADFVLRAWLENPHCDPDLVTDAVGAWLDVHGESGSASHVLAAWLCNPRAKPEIFAAAACRWLRDHDTSEAASHVLSAWLNNSKTDPCVAEVAVFRWLDVHGGSESASHVIGAWLGNQQADPLRVSPYLSIWLDAFSRHPDADFCLRKGLERKACRSDQLARNALEWLECWGLSERASYVLTELLRYPGAAGERLLAHLADWLELFADTPGASHIFPAWLENRQLSSEPIVRFLVPWLERHGSDPDADFVLCAWMESPERDPATVEKAVCRWLDLHGSSESARFVLEAWLKHPNAEPQKVAAATTTWLDAHGTCEFASHVLAAWFKNARTDPEIAVDTAIQWLDVHGNSLSAQFVLTYFLKNHKNDPRVIVTSTRRWLDAHGTTDTARFVLTAWLRHPKADPQVVALATAHWLDIHHKSTHASFVLDKYLANRKINPNLVERVAREWITCHGNTKSAWYVINRALERFGIDSQLRKATLCWIRRFGTIKEAGFVYLTWLKSVEDSIAIETPLRVWLAQHSRHDAAAPLRRLLQERKADYPRENRR